MLVITRQSGQSITVTIDGKEFVLYCYVKDRRIKLAMQAPDDFRIVRNEIKA